MSWKSYDRTLFSLSIGLAVECCIRVLYIYCLRLLASLLTLHLCLSTSFLRFRTFSFIPYIWYLVVIINNLFLLSRFLIPSLFSLVWCFISSRLLNLIVKFIWIPSNLSISSFFCSFHYRQHYCSLHGGDLGLGFPKICLMSMVHVITKMGVRSGSQLLTQLNN